MGNARILGTRVDNTVHEVAVDEYSGAIQTIDSAHYRVHRGQAFGYSLKTTLAAGASAFLLGKMGSGNVHFRHFTIGATDGPIDFELFEAPTTTANGTLQTSLNRNRASSNTSNISIYLGPTVTSNGTRLFINGVLADASFFSTVTSETTEPEEWILKSNTDYLIRLTNNASAGTATLYAGFFWYETD